MFIPSQCYIHPNLALSHPTQDNHCAVINGKRTLGREIRGVLPFPITKTFVMRVANLLPALSSM